MLIIQKKQLVVLSGAAIRDFESRMTEHIKECFPEHFAELGKENSLVLIRHAITAAQKYDIVTERDVCKYTNLMLSFGVDFDTDQTLPWVEQLLNDGSFFNGTEKIETLLETAYSYLQSSS